MPREGRIAMLFPGQGSQTAGMRDLVEEHRPDLLPLARELVGSDPFERVGQGTRWDQPALLCAALAGWEALRGTLEPDAMAGHSLGEVAALAAAGALSHEDALRVAVERGRLMEEFASDGGMLALRCTPSEAEEIARGHGLALANENSPSQTVVSGPAERLNALTAELRERGIRAKRLAVSGAFHSEAMAPAVAPFRAVLEELEVREPAVPVMSCVTAAPFDDVRERLAQALTHPVRWVGVLRGLRARGVTRFVESGPGRVLTGLVRRSLEGVEAEAPLAAEVTHA